MSRLWRIKRIIKQAHQKPISAPQEPSDWVGNAIRIAELAAATGDLLPFPYLKGAALLVSTLLKPIQQMRRNQEDCKALTVTITNLLQIVYEEVSQDVAFASSSEPFQEQCKDLETCLQRISDDIVTVSEKTKTRAYVISYMGTDRMKDRLASYQKEIEELRINFMFRNTLNSRIVLRHPALNARHYGITDEIISQFEHIRLCDMEVVQITSNDYSIEQWHVRLNRENKTRVAIIYKGRNAMEQWKADLEWYSFIRHPSIFQLFGFMSSKNSPGLIFHTDDHFLDMYRYAEFFELTVGNSPRSAMYTLLFGTAASTLSGYQAAIKYITDGAANGVISSGFSIMNPIHYKNRDDGYGMYKLKPYFNVEDGRVIFSFEWPSNMYDKAARDYTYRFILSPANPIVIESVRRIAKMTNIPDFSPSPSLIDQLLRDFHNSLPLFIDRDIASPRFANVIRVGDIIIKYGNQGNIASLPCKETRPAWCIRTDDLQYVLSPTSQSSVMAIDDMDGCIRISLSLNNLNDLFKCGVTIDHYVTGFSWHVQIQVPVILKHLDNTKRGKNLYLFIQKPPIHCETLETYWSDDPTGSGRLSPSDLVSCGLTEDVVKAYRTLSGCHVEYDYLELIEHFYEKVGINPESDEAAHILGLPMVQFHELPEKLEESKSDDSSSFHTADDSSSILEAEPEYWECES